MQRLKKSNRVYIGFGKHWGERYGEEEAAVLAECRMNGEERREAERMRREGVAEGRIVEWFFSGGFFGKEDAG